MLLSDLAGVLVLTVIFQPSHQGPAQLGSEDQSLDQSFPYVPSEPQFGQRLHPLRSSARQTSVPPTHLSTFLSTLSTPSAEIEEYDEPLQQRSLLTGDPIVVNKSEGACAFEGRIYQSGENIQRNHLCHFCFCRNGYIDCYWKNCPPAPEGCIELNYEGVCERSLYHCPIPSTNNNIPFPRPVRSAQRYRRHFSKQNFTALGCNILGVHYRVGELVGVATDPCLECRCAINALYCSPKCCFQPAEPDDVSQQLQRSAGHQPVLSNPLQHLRSEFSRHLDSA